MMTKKRLLCVALALGAGALYAQFAIAAGKPPKRTRAAAKNASVKYGFASGADQVLSAVYDSSTNALRVEGGTGGGGSSVSLQTNGLANGSQSTLNLENGSNIALANAAGTGNVTVSFTGILPASLAAAAHTWISGYNAATGAFTSSQPSFLDLSGTLSAAQLPAGVPAFSGLITVGDCAKWLSSGVLADAGAPCGSGAGTITLAGDLAGTMTSQIVVGIQNHSISPAAPSSGQVLEWNTAANAWTPTSLPALGTVTSVGLSLPSSLFTVSSSPVTTSGTLTGALANQNANLVFAGPSSGTAASPAFRALTAADIPVLNYQAPLSGYAAPSNEFLTGFTAPGTFTAAQPSFANLSGTATLGQLPSTLAQFGGSITANDCAKWSSSGVLMDAGAACGSGGSATTIQVNGASAASQSPINFQSGGYITVSNPSAGNIQFNFSGPLAVANGGTGLTTLGTNGQCLSSNGTAMVWQTCGSGGGSPWGVNAVTFSATPVFNASLGNVQKITLTGNVTSSTLTNAVAGQLITFDVCQDATGGRSFVWPTNMVGTFTIPQGANQCVRQSFAYDGTNAVAQDASQGDGFLLAASSALEPNARTLTCGSGISCVDGGAGGSFNISGSSLVDLTSTQTITGTKTLAGPLVHQFANAASPGTTQYESVMVAASGTVTAGTASTGVIGVCIIGCGTSGNASVAVEGVVNAMFDTASITAGDYVTATASGTFHDTGSATYPTSGQVQGKIITSGTSCNTSPGCPFLKFPEEIEAASGGGSSAWSGLTNAGANLTLSNGAYSTTFNQTSSANWLWANTTAATSSVEADSPILLLEGSNWSGATPASAADSWTIQDVTGAGTNPVSTLTFSHSGSSTATPNAQISLNGMMVAPNSITTPAGNTLILKTTTPSAGVYIAPGGTARVGIGSTGMTFEQTGDHFTNAAANSDLAGTIVITSATSVSQTFATAYTAAPVCVLTPTSNPGSLTWWVTTTTTSVTANLSASGTVTFNYICMGNPN